MKSPAINSLKLLWAVSSRQHGNMSLSYGATQNSTTHRQVFLKELGIDYCALTCAEQIHGSGVRYVQDADRGCGALDYHTALAQTDALVTDQANLPLAIFTADCLSLFLYDPKLPAVGLVHAGWRSTRQNIAVKTLKLMQEKFGTAAEDLQVKLGPCIRECCYQVGEEFGNYFDLGLVKREDNYYLDLAGINQQQLVSQGVKAENITDSKACTFCQNDRFFSYRKEGISCGRMMSVAMLC